MRPSPRAMKRRRFVQVLALSGAALVTAPLSNAVSAPARRAAADARRRLTPAMRQEIANQERTLARQLQTIRTFRLDPGSPMAFAFRPLRARRGR